MVKECWNEKGYVDEPIDKNLDLKKEIRKLCKEKDAIILAHYYTVGDIQDIADFVGDSLALARKAAETDAKVMVMCGVHFMAETCKLLSPDKTVLCPDLNAELLPRRQLQCRGPEEIQEGASGIQGGKLCEHHCRRKGTHRLCGNVGKRSKGHKLIPKG